MEKSVNIFMKGYIKIVGVNDGSTRLKDASGQGELVYQFHKNYTLKFQNEEFFVELLDFIIEEKVIEFSAWIGDKEHQYGRVAFQFEPNN